jgi:hypothetical protein
MSSMSTDEPMSDRAFQDHYRDSVAQCYGCGRLNADGLQIKTR